MRSFDIKALNYGVDQYWSSLDVTTNTVNPQVTSGVSGIVFTSSPIADNRNITSDSVNSIRLSDDPGEVTADEFSDFNISMLIYPEASDLWVIKLETDQVLDLFTDTLDPPDPLEVGTNIGVKVNSDSTISLIWSVDAVLLEKRLVFTEEVCYLAVNKTDKSITMQLNNEQVTIEGDDYIFEGFTLGSGEGSFLVDKIALAITGGVLPKPDKYFGLFRSQRLDNVSRPNGASGFSYINENTFPIVKRIDQTQFTYEDGYFYAGMQNPLEDGVFSIDRRTGFDMEYSVDNGLSWNPLELKSNFTEVYPNIIFRHDMSVDNQYFLEARISGTPNLPLPFFDVVFDGPLHLPQFIGQGYYDVEQADMTNASITITPQEDPIRTIEFLGEVNETNPAWLDTTGADVYINGQPGSISDMRPHQIYHVVVVYPTDQTSVVINSGKDCSSSIAGLGASVLEYTASDAYYIFNTFAGNTYVSILETIGELSDGIAPNSDDSEPISALSVQWNT